MADVVGPQLLCSVIHDTAWVESMNCNGSLQAQLHARDLKAAAHLSPCFTTVTQPGTPGTTTASRFWSAPSADGSTERRRGKRCGRLDASLGEAAEEFVAGSAQLGERPFSTEPLCPSHCEPPVVALGPGGGRRARQVTHKRRLWHRRWLEGGAKTPASMVGCGGCSTVGSAGGSLGTPG